MDLIRPATKTQLNVVISQVTEARRSAATVYAQRQLMQAAALLEAVAELLDQAEDARQD